MKYLIAGLFSITYLLLSVLSSPLASAAACSSPPTTYGTDSLTFSATSTTTYSVWVNMQTPVASSNSIMLQVNGSSCFNVGGSSSMPLNSWNWISYQNGSSSSRMSVNLTSGTNTLKLIGTQPGVMINSVLFLGDSNCTPTGDGSNCTVSTVPSAGASPTSPPSTKQTTSNSGSNSTSAPVGHYAITASGALILNNASVEVSSPISISPTVVPGLTIKQVYYYLDDKLIYSTDKPPFIYRLNVSSLLRGKYILSSNTIYTNGQSRRASETIYVSHSLGKNTAIYASSHLVLLLILLVVIWLWIWQVFMHRSNLASAFFGLEHKLHLKNDDNSSIVIGNMTPPSNPIITQPEATIISPTKEGQNNQNINPETGEDLTNTTLR
ncbi:MAG TPA: hypothetical protein VIH90_02805 [Candidatus Saccharimonadales bacterium]